MLRLRCYFVLFVFLLCWTTDAQRSPPFDVRINHYKVGITHDLIINTPRPRFSWKIPVFSGASQRNVQQTAYQLQLQSTTLAQRYNHFKWDSEQIVSSQSTHVPYTGHVDLMPETNYRFRLRIWTTLATQPSEWTQWIRFRTPIFNLHEYVMNNADLLWIGSTQIYMNELRKEFMVPNTSPIRSAVTYISGLGYYELYLNGINVDPSRKLDPGWTTYEKRTFLASFDLTANIMVGMNAVGVKLGNGWYSRELQKESSYGPPRLLFILTITFENGEEMQVVSDQTWTGRQGSILYDSVYNGEFYDARSVRPNWARVGFNDSLSAWIMPESMPPPLNVTLNGQLILQDILPIRAGLDALHVETSQENGYLKTDDIEEMKGAPLTDGGSGVLKPVAMWQPTVGIYIFDIGQNMAGWCRVKLVGARGAGVFIRHSEILAQPLMSTGQSYGGLSTESLRSAAQTDIYVLRGDPAGEIYEPTFTVHGFRYLSVSGAPNPLTVNDVECPVVHSETTLIGQFSTSNPVVNQIQQNIQWGQLSNIMSIPTACSQRDERTGWTGDAALSVDAALYNFDLIKFYSNYLDSLIDLQLPNGAIPDVAPGGGGYPADPNWGTALPTITWQLYRHSNDSLILADYYSPVRAYVENVRSGYNNTGLANLAYQFGDWVPPPPYTQTNAHLIASFGFLHDVSLLINISQVLGKTSDTQAYSTFYQLLADEFHRDFFTNSSNFYADGSQAAQVLALALPNVVPTSVRDVVLAHLVADIGQKGNHVTTGIVSTAQIYPVLSDNGHHDLALELVSATTYPSFGYMFTNPYENATALWELWDSPSEGPGMNSRNHVMFGSVGAWFYSYIAGIDLSSDMITIRPRMASEAKKHLMAKINCQLSTLYGIVHVSYTRSEYDTAPNSILLRVTIPPNARARVIFEPLLIGGHCVRLIEGNKVIWSPNASSTHLQQFEIERDTTTGLMMVSVGSGQYEFQAIWQ